MNSFRDLNPTTATTAASALVQHWPGQIGQVCILDAPLAFKMTWGLITPFLDAATAAKVQMLRGDAMASYFREHFTDEQTAFMTTVLKMPAKPGSLPPETARLKMPLDNRNV